MLSDSLTGLCIVERSLDDHIPAVPCAGLGPAAARAESTPADPAHRLGQVIMMIMIMMMNMMMMMTIDHQHSTRLVQALQLPGLRGPGPGGPHLDQHRAGPGE